MRGVSVQTKPVQRTVPVIRGEILSSLKGEMDLGNLGYLVYSPKYCTGRSLSYAKEQRKHVDNSNWKYLRSMKKGAGSVNGLCCYCCM